MAVLRLGSKKVKDDAGLVGVLVKDDNSVNVPNGWAAREGAQLVEGLMVGKALGQGFQGVIHELVDAEGRKAPIVLKAAKPGALISDMEREWAAGVKVGTLATPDGQLRGFMKREWAAGVKVGSLVTPNGELRGFVKVGPALRNSQGKLVGQVLGRINGKSVSKIISKRDFNDIHFLHAMLKQAFTALDVAQRSFGMHHYDLRCDNIMEHTPSREECATDELSVFVMGDPATRSYEREFKIIDYGLTKFDDHYSWASGWVEQTYLAQRTPGTVSAETAIAAEVQEVKQQVQAGGKVKDPNKLVGMEWIHKSAWRGKGDCYHILLDISRMIYGHTWPREDAVMVYLLMALINHTTSVLPQAFFTAPDLNAPAADAAADVVADTVGGKFPTRFKIQQTARTPIGRAWQGYLRWSLVRRAARQLKAWQYPSNSGLRASEALCCAFFLDGLDGASHPSTMPPAIPPKAVPLV